ncbi:YesL family protein [Mesobacillus foraminis]|uniref:YesL family protein n=1 Tax=Mesobacillus foraminis TaxID=279826 RepID=UPI001BE9C440|nr:YesL family protein [Mesobacillus foraminis]MBT2758869.1 YesL family protein [Mesobacillus foraminis]
MELKGLTGKFYRVSEFIMNLAYINLLWIFFSLAGGVILGWAPSTVAMFTVIRKWIMKEEELKITKTWWQTYKAEFVKANALGYVLLAIGFVLIVNFRFFHAQEGLVFLVLQTFTVFIIFLFLLTCIYIFPAYVHYHLKFFQYFNQAMIIGLIRPLYSAVIIAALLIISYILFTLPGLVPFYGVSLAGFIITVLVCQCFARMEQQSQEQQS